MDNLVLSFNVVLPIFFMMALGYVIKRVGLADDASLKKFNNVTFRVFLPILLFNNIYNTDIKSALYPKMMIFGAAATLTIYTVVFILTCILEKDNKKRGVMIQGIFRSNFILFGLPVVLKLYGQEAMGATSLMIAVIVPIYNVFSVVALEVFRSSKINAKKILKGIATNPLILGSVIGLLTLLSGIRFPHVIEETISDISKIATPLALIILGASMNFKTVTKNLKYIIVGVSGKLVIGPFFGIMAAAALGFRNVELAILLSMFASPTAVSSFTMAQQMDADADLAGQLVVFDTTISIFTMFIWVFILKQMCLM